MSAELFRPPVFGNDALGLKPLIFVANGARRPSSTNSTPIMLSLVQTSFDRRLTSPSLVITRKNSSVVT